MINTWLFQTIKKSWVINIILFLETYNYDVWFENKESTDTTRKSDEEELTNTTRKSDKEESTDIQPMPELEGDEEVKEVNKLTNVN